MLEAQMHQPDGVAWHKSRVEMRTLLKWVSIVNGFDIGVGSRTFSFGPCFGMIHSRIYTVSRKPKYMSKHGCCNGSASSSSLLLEMSPRTFSFRSCFRTIHTAIHTVHRKLKRYVETRALLQWLSVVNGFVIRNELAHLQRRVMLQDDPYSDPYSAQEVER